MNQEMGPNQTNKSTSTLILNFPASITMKNKCLLHISHLDYGNMYSIPNRVRQKTGYRAVGCCYNKYLKNTEAALEVSNDVSSTS
jgi:hypothetical protein